MAKNHMKTNIIGVQCAVECFKPHLTCGTTKTLVPKIPKNSGSTPTPCLAKEVFAQGGGGVPWVVRHTNQDTTWCAVCGACGNEA